MDDEIIFDKLDKEGALSIALDDDYSIDEVKHIKPVEELRKQNHKLMHRIFEENQTKAMYLAWLNFSLSVIFLGCAVSFRDAADLIVKKINEANQITFYQKLVQAAPAIISGTIYVTSGAINYIVPFVSKWFY